MLMYSSHPGSQSKSPCRPRPQLPRLQIPVQNSPPPACDAVHVTSGADHLESEKRTMATAVSLPPRMGGFPHPSDPRTYPYPSLSSTPLARPRRREKPQLSIITTQTRSFGKGASLRLETLSAISPTVRNTYRNAYERHSRESIPDNENERDVDSRPWLHSAADDRRPTLSIDTSAAPLRPNRPKLSITTPVCIVEPHSPFSATTPISAYVTAPTSPICSESPLPTALPSPSHLRIDPAHLAEKFRSAPLQLVSPTTPTPLSTPSLTSTPSTASTFSNASERLPYVIPDGLRSILVNSPFHSGRKGADEPSVSAPISPEQELGFIATATVPVAKARKRVAFRAQIEDVIENTVYTATHFSLYTTLDGDLDATMVVDVPPTVSGNLGSDPPTVSVATATATSPPAALPPLSIPTPQPLSIPILTAPRPPRARPSLSLAITPSHPAPSPASLHPSLPSALDDDPHEPPPSHYPTTPVAGRRKRERNWVWTLGPLPGTTGADGAVGEDDEAEPPPTGLRSPEAALFAGFEQGREDDDAVDGMEGVETAQTMG